MRRKFLLLAIVSCLLATGVSLAKPSFDWWPMIGHDNLKSGTSKDNYLPFTMPFSESKKDSWDVSLSNLGGLGTPVVKDGILYIVQQGFYDKRSGNRQEGTLRQYDIFTGDLLLEQTFNAVDVPEPGVVGSPAVWGGNEEKTVVVGDYLGNIVYFRGTFPKKLVDAGGERTPITSSPTIYDNTCYIGSDSGNVYAFDLAELRITGSFKAKGKITTSPSALKDLVVFGDDSGSFFAYNRKTGKQIINTQPSARDEISITSSSCITESQGKTYAIFGSSKGLVHRITIGGSNIGQITSFRTSPDRRTQRPTFWATPTIVDGQIYAGADDGNLYRIDLETMKPAGMIDLKNPIFAQATSAGKYLYVCTASLDSEENPAREGNLYTIDLDTFTIDQTNSSGIEIKGGSLTQPVIAGGYMFVASRSGKIYRFEGARPQLMVSPTQINFGTIKFGTAGQRDVIISNNGPSDPPLVGEILVDEQSKSWLSIDKSEFKTSGETKLTVKASSSGIKNIRETEYSGTVSIETNAGTQTIEVKATFAPDLPRIQVSSSQIDFMDTYRGRKNLREFAVSLAKGSMATLDFKSSDSWLECSPQSATLSEGKKSIKISVTASTENLATGKYAATIQIGNQKTIANPVTLPVTINVVPQPARPSIVNSSVEVVFQDCFMDKPKEAVFQILNSGDNDLKESIKPILSTSWLSSPRFVKNKGNSWLYICTISPSTFWPNQQYTASINTMISSTPITLKINAKTMHIPECKIEFSIGSKQYTVNGRSLPMDAPPYVSKNGSTMVPIRYIGDPLGYFYKAQTEWVKELKTVLFTLAGTTLRLIVDYQNAIVEKADGSIDTIKLASPPEIKNGRTFIPPRIIGETFGAKISWDDRTRKATLVFNQPSP